MCTTDINKTTGLCVCHKTICLYVCHKDIYKTIRLYACHKDIYKTIGMWILFIGHNTLKQHGLGMFSELYKQIALYIEAVLWLVV